MYSDALVCISSSKSHPIPSDQHVTHTVFYLTPAGQRDIVTVMDVIGKSWLNTAYLMTVIAMLIRSRQISTRQTDRPVIICAKVTRSMLATDELHKIVTGTCFSTRSVTQMHLNSVSCLSFSSDQYFLFLCFQGVRRSDDGSLGGGQVDGLDAGGQGFLQVL